MCTYINIGTGCCSTIRATKIQDGGPKTTFVMLMLSSFIHRIFRRLYRKWSWINFLWTLLRLRKIFWVELITTCRLIKRFITYIYRINQNVGQMFNFLAWYDVTLRHCLRKWASLGVKPRHIFDELMRLINGMFCFWVRLWSR